MVCPAVFSIDRALITVDQPFLGQKWNFQLELHLAENIIH
jgi:hypothetical protein